MDDEAGMARTPMPAQARLTGLAAAELDRLYRLAGLILGSAAEAEDAVGDALLRGWRSAADLRDPAGFQPWLDRIVVNACRDRLRRRGRVRFIALGPEHDRPLDGDPFRALAERDRLIAAMQALPADERIVLVLHYWADLTLEDVAGRLATPVGTVKSRLHRALAGVRSHLDGR